MYRLAVERGPGIAFWLLALAAQMSGYTNVAIALALVGVAIFFLLAPVYHHVRKWHEKRRLKGRALEPNHLILIGVIGTVLFAGIGAAGFIWQYLRGPQPVSGALYWSAASREQEGSPLAFDKTPTLGWQKQGDGRVDARTLSFLGTNIGSEEITLTDIYIVSGVTGQRIDLLVEARQDNQTAILARPKDINPIPPKADFRVSTAELNGTQGIPEADFMRDWGTIIFVAEYDGQKHRITFGRSAIEAMFAPQRPQPLPPHVTKKSNAADARPAQSPSPREIRALYEGRTPLQAEKLLLPYKGLRMNTEGRIVTVLADGQGGSVAVIDNNGDMVECRFNSKWVPALSRVNKGNTLNVSGTIADHQNGSQVYLLNCEIIEA
jgi:hypothetical protein